MDKDIKWLPSFGVLGDQRSYLVFKTFSHTSSNQPKLKMPSTMNGTATQTNGFHSEIPAIEAQPSFLEPLVLSGILDKFQYEDTTPALGREFTSVNIVDDLLNAENVDDLLRDLAITSELADC